MVERFGVIATEALEVWKRRSVGSQEEKAESSWRLPTNECPPKEGSHVKRKMVLVGAAVAATLALSVSNCSSGGNAGTSGSGDTLTQRQKDSIVGTLPVPGAGAVGKAMEAADSLRSRALQHDTIH